MKQFIKKILGTKEDELNQVKEIDNNRVRVFNRIKSLGFDNITGETKIVDSVEILLDEIEALRKNLNKK